MKRPCTSCNSTTYKHSRWHGGQPVSCTDCPPTCPECQAPLDEEHSLRSGAVCPTLEPVSP